MRSAMGGLLDSLAPVLALHGMLVLLVGLAAGLLLHRTIRLGGENAAAWHLTHAGVSGRGVLLIALAGTARWVHLPDALGAACVWLMLFFVWTSTAAMVVAAATGDRGLTWSGSLVNRLVFALYVAGAIAVFPAAILLIAGFVQAR
jgi:hypothetical protein